jgi:hypothetical protein
VPLPTDFFLAARPLAACSMAQKRAQDRASAASRNDVWVKDRSAPNRIY